MMLFPFHVKFSFLPSCQFLTCVYVSMLPSAGLSEHHNSLLYVYHSVHYIYPLATWLSVTDTVHSDDVTAGTKTESIHESRIFC